MITSQPVSFLSEIVSGAPIPPEKLGYFRGRLSNRFHEVVLELFDELERAGKITRAALARRIGKAPEQITRWLGAPGNYTLDTISDLFLGMGYEPVVSAEALTVQEEVAQNSWEELPDDLPANVIEISYATNVGMQSYMTAFNTKKLSFDTYLSNAAAYQTQNSNPCIAGQWNQLTNAQALPRMTVKSADYVRMISSPEYVFFALNDQNKAIESEATIEKIWRRNLFEQIGAQQPHKAALLKGMPG